MPYDSQVCFTLFRQNQINPGHASLQNKNIKDIMSVVFQWLPL